ncbi:MAG: Rieske 2Fe-2S domain-containing protein [Owenweeksia sp.]|nr:Rieske 2Fe-2S domain-containing protein [Owenweeksia sp.]
MSFATDFYKASGNLVEHWYAVFQTKDLKKSPLKAVVFDLPFVLWRNSEGMAKAAIDRCPHRDAPLSHGRVEHGCIACPYHGWKFNGEGECVEIPSQVEEKHLKGHHLHVVPCVEKYGLIWIWTGSRPAFFRAFCYAGNG